jgi:hypothetical protein
MAQLEKRKKRRSKGLETASSVLKRHFRGLDVANLITSNREYPVPARVDLQRALDELLPQFSRGKQLGIHAEYAHETLTMGHLLANRHSPVVIGPLQYEEIDVGETLAVPCVRRALWIGAHNRTPFALTIGEATRFGSSSGTNVEVAVPPGEKGAEIARCLLDNIETRVRGASSYRGKVLSLEAANRYDGSMGPIRVHKLRQVRADQLVLPQQTVALLDRNVIGFVAQREKLKSLGLAAKKGLLFYGPPGTGKTYTVHYLATQLPSHTTLLITAEQVGLLDHYFQLARFLQPALIVIEDVDLIARSRRDMNSPCEEALLNKLLNEMDGLREDAEILFVLTTNRPDQLEAALASRPGRIDQAIEFPLPDEAGRRQLTHLYAYGLEMGPEVVELIVRRTAGGSAALIKELMRRAAQFLLEAGGTQLQSQHIESALEEMLLSGGSLNSALLGGVGVQHALK